MLYRPTEHLISLKLTLVIREVLDPAGAMSSDVVLSISDFLSFSIRTSISFANTYLISPGTQYPGARCISIWSPTANELQLLSSGHSSWFVVSITTTFLSYANLALLETYTQPFPVFYQILYSFWRDRCLCIRRAESYNVRLSLGIKILLSLVSMVPSALRSLYRSIIGYKSIYSYYDLNITSRLNVGPPPYHLYRFYQASSGRTT